LKRHEYFSHFFSTFPDFLEHPRVVSLPYKKNSKIARFEDHIDEDGTFQGDEEDLNAFLNSIFTNLPNTSDVGDDGGFYTSIPISDLTSHVTEAPPLPPPPSNTTTRSSSPVSPQFQVSSQPSSNHSSVNLSPHNSLKNASTTGNPPSTHSRWSIELARELWGSKARLSGELEDMVDEEEEEMVVEEMIPFLSSPTSSNPHDSEVEPSSPTSPYNPFKTLMNSGGDDRNNRTVNRRKKIGYGWTKSKQRAKRKKTSPSSSSQSSSNASSRDPSPLRSIGGTNRKRTKKGNEKRRKGEDVVDPATSSQSSITIPTLLTSTRKFKKNKMKNSQSSTSSPINYSKKSESTLAKNEESEGDDMSSKTNHPPSSPNNPRFLRAYSASSPLIPTSSLTSNHLSNQVGSTIVEESINLDGNALKYLFCCFLF